MSVSPGPTCPSACLQPVEDVVENTKRTDGSFARIARISCPATATSPTLTAWIHIGEGGKVKGEG